MRCMKSGRTNSRSEYPRQRDEIVYVYGKHVVDLALERQAAALKHIYVSPQFRDERLLAKIRRAQIKTQPLDERRLPGQLARDVNHQGLVAALDTSVLVQPYQQYIKQAPIEKNTLFLLLAEIHDPQNVGAMIRSAAAFGVQAVLLPTHQQAPLTGTVAKVSAGMVFTVPLVSIKNVNTTIADLQSRGVAAYGLAGEGAESIHLTDFSTASVLVVGNEGAGLREKTRATCDALVTIPMHPRCESLNAASAVTASLAVWSKQHGDALSA